MRTEQDLKEVYQTLEAQAPDSATVLARSQSRSESPGASRWYLVGAAATAVAAVLVLVATLVRQDSAGPATNPSLPETAASAAVSTDITVTVTSPTSGMVSDLPTDLAAPVSTGPDFAASSTSGNSGSTGERTVRLPFTIGYLPNGLRIVSASTEVPGPQGAAIGLVDNTGVQVGEPFATAMTIWVTNLSDPDTVLCGTGEEPLYDSTPVTVNGHIGCILSDFSGPAFGLYLPIDGAHVEILLDQDHQGIYTGDQLVQIASSIVAATSFDDETTWFETTIG